MPYIYSRLKHIISRGGEPPKLPPTAVQLHRVLDDPNSGTADVARLIEQDPELAARLVRMSNEISFERTGARVTSVSTAVSLVGVDHVRAVSLLLAIMKAFGDRRARFDDGSFWSHCATVASLSSKLWARVGNSDAIRPSDAYVVGLLHDLGLLVIDEHFPTELSALLKSRPAPDTTLALLEEEYLGIDHGAVAGLLIGRWSMPSFVADAIAHHNHPDDAPPETARLALVLAAAEAMCWQLDLGLPIEGRPVQSAEQLLRALDVDESEYAEMIDWTYDSHAFATGCLA